MSAAPVLQESSWETFVEVWNRLDLPEGWRAEIIEERIVMSPPPGQNHNLIGSRVNKALVRALPDDWEGSADPRHRNAVYLANRGA